MVARFGILVQNQRHKSRNMNRLGLMRGGWAVRAALLGFASTLSWAAWAQTNIVRVGSIASDGTPAALKDRYLYAFSPHSGLRIFDVSNPTNAVDVGYRDTEMCQAMALSGNYAYVINVNLSISFNPVWLQILDISNPTNPVAV